MTTQATYYPARGKLLARITLDGKFVAIFKVPPTDEQGNAMAKAMMPAPLPNELDEQHWDQTTDDYGVGFNACLKLWKESLK